MQSCNRGCDAAWLLTRLRRCVCCRRNGDQIMANERPISGQW
nr:MAG TPA: hypothetical protein [Caudoviricetes sp.]